MVCEENVGTVDDAIIYYSTIAGLCIENSVHVNDLTIITTNDNAEVKYIYNYKQKYLRRHDISGVRYYSTVDNETKREKLIFLYELKKIYLQSKYQQGSCEWATGKFNIHRLIEGNDTNEQLTDLDRKIKDNAKVIHILNEEDCNYGDSFGKQALSFVNVLTDLKECSVNLNEAEINEQVISYARESLLKNVSLVSTEGKSPLNIIYESDKYKFIDEFGRSLNHNNLVQKITELTNSQTFVQIQNECSEDYFGGLIRDLKHQCLKIRKTEIEKEINRTKLIEAEIRKKELEIRNAKTSFNRETQISDENVEKYEILLKAQRLETNQNYKNGLNRVKELSKNNSMQMGIRSSRYDATFEARNLDSLIQATNNDEERLLQYKIKISRKHWDANNLREDRIPVLEHKFDSLQRVKEELKKGIEKLKSLNETEENNRKTTDNKINIMELSNKLEVKELTIQYKQLSDCLKQIDKFKLRVEDLKLKKDDVKRIERRKFDDTVFSKTGGAKSASDVTGSESHEMCVGSLFVTCKYKIAMIDAVNFTLGRIEDKKYTLDSDAVNALWRHLSGYNHSARSGNGSHVEALKQACTITFGEYINFQENIKTEENKYQLQITETESQQNSQEFERDRLRKLIISKENEINDRYIKLSEATKANQVIAHKIDCTNTEIGLMKKYLKSTNEPLLVSVTEELHTKHDDLNELMTNTAEQVRDFNDEMKNLKEFKNDFMLCETRWRYGHYETFLTNIGVLEKLKLEYKSVTSEIQSIDEIKQVNLNNQNILQLNVKSENEKLMSISKSLEDLFTKQCKLLCRLLRYEEKDFNFISISEEIMAKRLKNQQRQVNFVTDINKYKRTMIERGFYRTLNDKGTIYQGSDHSNSVDFTGTAKQLYKKRKHKTCQDIENHSKVCKYFDALYVILDILLNMKTKTNSEIIESLKTSETNLENHLLSKHKLQIDSNINIIRDVIEDYDKEVLVLKNRHKVEIDSMNEEFENACENVEKKNKLVDYIAVKRTTDPEEKCHNYIDCLVFDEKEISTIKNSKMAMCQFVSKIDPTIDCTDDLKEEIDTLLNSYRVVAMEDVLWQTENTCQQKLFHILIPYFNKTYLKNKIQIIAESNLLLDTEKEIKKNEMKIDRIVKDSELLERKRSCLNQVLHLLDDEIVRVQQHNVFNSDNEQFDVMQSQCIQLLEVEKSNNKDMAKLIEAEKQKLKSLKNECNNIKLGDDVLLNLKTRILQSRLKLEIDSKDDQHRKCRASCDYFTKLNELLDHMISKMKTGKLVLRPSEFKVTSDNQKYILDDLKISKCPSNDHNNAFKRIISYTAQIYGVELQKELFHRLLIIDHLELEIAEIEATKEASDSIIIPALSSKIKKIKQFMIFRKGVLYIDKPIDEGETVMNTELLEYKQETENTKFRSQTKYLLICLTESLSQIKKSYKPASSINHSANNDLLLAINKCFYDVFINYCDNLDYDYCEKPLVAIINQLKLDVKREGNESKFKILARKKAGKMGMVEYLVKAVSQSFKENYDRALNPEYIYYRILEAELSEKKQCQESTLKKLQTELVDLKQQRKLLFFQDNSMLRNVLQNVETCIQFLENSRDIASLRFKAEELDHWRKSDDDYYSFIFENKRVSVRLLSTDSFLKSAEINNIDIIREYSTTQNLALSRLQVINEELNLELRTKMEIHLKECFTKIQRKLFLHGFLLCRFESFENGEVLDEINSVISTIIGVLVKESNLFQLECSNETTKSIEGWTRNIRRRYETLTNFAQISVLNKNLNSIQLNDLTKAINDEFETDNLSVMGIKVLNDNAALKGPNSPPLSIPGIHITLLEQNLKYFAIIPRDECKLCANNTQIETSMKITYVLGLLDTEKELFKVLFERRLFEISGCNIEVCSDLAQVYKNENMLLTKVLSLKEFISAFSNLLETKDEEWDMISLFAYLTYLEELESSKEMSSVQLNVESLNIIKRLYGEMMFARIKAEEQRRRKNRLVGSEVSKEELYLNELIEDCQRCLPEILEAISKCNGDIEKDKNLKDALLFEKMTVKEKYREQIQILSSITLDLKEEIKVLQEDIKQLNQNQLENQKEIATKQANLKILEANLKDVANEIELKEQCKQTIELQLNDLKIEMDSLQVNLKRVNDEKERCEKEEREKKCEQDAGKSLMQLIRNFEVILGTYALQTANEQLKKAIHKSNDLQELLEYLKNTLQGIPVDDSNFWQKLIQDINYEQLQQFLLTGKKIAGETQQTIVDRFRNMLIATVNCEFDIQQEVVNGKCIKRFKVSSGNVSSVEIHSKIKNHVLREMTSHGSCGGFSFENDVLKCSEYGITQISALPNELRTLVEKRIELKYKSEFVDRNKQAKFTEASKIINKLEINYFDIVRCYVDEIEIVSRGTFFLNDSLFCPGIDLTISAINMECIGKNLEINTSGKDGKTFSHKASNGSRKRLNISVPRGDKAYDGYDGDHGGHAGNIIIKVENEIINDSRLIAIKANGGNGGEGQLGGDGDEGAKGHDGKDGNAGDTMALQGGQTEIGFGKPGSPGGPGGPCGYSGRPGLRGKPGNISIEHKSKKITEAIMNTGKDADNVLDKNKPSGGLGGEPGYYGMDEVKVKDDILTKTETLHTVIDRSALINRYPELTEKILNSRNISSSLLGSVTESVIQAALKFKSVISKKIFGDRTKELSAPALPVTAPGIFDPVAIVFDPAIIDPAAIVSDPAILIPAAVVAAPAAASAVISGAAIVGIFADYKLTYNEANNPTQYRDRDRKNHDKRGKKNEEAACLRNDSRTPQQEKRDSTNIENLQNKLNEAKKDQKEISGELAHEEYIYDLEMEREEVLNKIDLCSQEASDIQSKIDNCAVSVESKRFDLDKVIEDIASLRNKESTLNMTRKGDIQKIVGAIKRSQNLQDEKTNLDLNIQQLLVTLDQNTALGETYFNNYHAHVRIIDEYLDVVKDSLQGNMQELKSLKKDYSDKEQEARALIQNLDTMQKDRALVTETESEIVEEIEQEAEIVHKQELTQVVDADICLKDSKINSGNNHMICKEKNVYLSNNGEETRIADIMNNIIALTSLERHLLLNQLKKFLVLLSDDPLSNLKMEKCLESFVLKSLEKIEKSQPIKSKGVLKTLLQDGRNLVQRVLEDASPKDTPKVPHLDTSLLKSCIGEKLRQRFENAHLLNNDNLSDDIMHLVDLINNTKNFNLQHQLHDEAESCTLIPEWQTNILIYSRNPSMEKLKLLVAHFKLATEKAKQNKEATDFLQKFSGRFVFTTIENIRYYGALALHQLINNEITNENCYTEIQHEAMIRQIRDIHDDLTSLTVVKIDDAKIEVINQLSCITSVFFDAVKNLKTNANSKKEFQNALQSFEAISVKLLYYVDSDSNSFSSDMNKIADKYKDLFSLKDVDIDVVDDVEGEIEVARKHVLQAKD